MANPTDKPSDHKVGQTSRLRELWPDLWVFIRPRRWIIALGFLLMAINRLAGLVLPASSKYLIDNVIGRHNAGLLVPLVSVVIAATVVQGITDFALTQLLSKEAQRLIAELRVKVQQHIGRLPIAYYDATKTGALVSRIMNDVEGLRNLIGTGLVQFVGGILTAIFALVVLLKISVVMTAVAAGILLVFGVCMRYAFRIIRPIFRARPKINAEVTGRLTESLAGVRVVKGYHAERREARVFAGGVERLLNNVLQTLTATSVMSLTASTLLGLVSALIMLLGAHRIMGHTMTLGSFVEFTIFLAMLIAPVAQVVNIGTQLTEAIAGLERTREVLAERPEDADPMRSVELGVLSGEIVFEEVSFSYEPGKPVLNDVSFRSSPGTVTALVGPSGAGKSTLIGLVAAFYIPTRGRVLVDGIELSTARLDSYRTQLGVVLQDTFLFDGTIRENVAFSRPGATEEQILAACRIARVDEFAERFELRYETVVGERGVKLSGGQKQRVSIARAILADPRILILDEATSSLDSESEALIQEGLAYLMQGRTTFVIAHRLSTVRRADQILVIENGRIVERGTHESLYALEGRYWELYTRQHGIEQNRLLVPGEKEKEEEPEIAARSNGRDGEGALPGPVTLLRGQGA
ncbi:MAG TPA: ABC transporter ATP-binding protein [Terriglobia bacterium]|nr:ABC transporter ATP-binding protein [Terriglobia bacterium]